MRRGISIRFVAFAAICAACTPARGAVNPPAHHGTKTADAPVVHVDVHVADHGAAPATVLDGVRTTLDHYVTAATVTGLRAGHAGDLTEDFSPDTIAGLTGTDRAALVDEGITGVTRVRIDRAVATVDSLHTDTGDLASTRLEVTVTALVGTTPVTVRRTADFVLIPVGDRWQIDGYDVTVNRDSADASVTPSSSASRGGRP